MKRTVAVSICLVFALMYAANIFAQDDAPPPNPKWAVTFHGGVARGVTYDDGLNSANKSHAFLGGGLYRYPFSTKNKAAAGLGLGVELGRMVLATNEPFYSIVGETRFQDKLWPITLGARYDLPSPKLIQATLYGAYVPSRKTTALQVPNPYGRGWVTLSQRDLQYYYGVQCLECASSFTSKFGVGASVAFVKQSTNYRRENSGRSWELPLFRYMLYRPNGFTTFTLGMAYRF